MLLAAGLLPASLAASRAGLPGEPTTVDTLVAAAQTAAATDGDLSVLLAAEAYRAARSPRSYAALLSAVDATTRLSREASLDAVLPRDGAGDDAADDAAGGAGSSDGVGAGDDAAGGAGVGAGVGAGGSDGDGDGRVGSSEDGSEDGTVRLDGEVTAMAAQPLTEEVLAATSAGDVVRWDLAGTPRLVGSTGRWVTELAASDLGNTVAALDVDGAVHLLPDDPGLVDASDPADGTDGRARPQLTSALDIAVSPSGMLLAALVDDADGRRVEVRYAGTRTAVARLSLDDDTYDSVDLGDDYVVLSTQDSRQGAQGGWERRSVPGMKLVRRGSALPDIGYGAETIATAATSPHGVVAASVHALVTTVTSTQDGSSTPLQSTNPALPVTLDVRTVVLSPNATQYLVVRDQRTYLFDLTQGNAFWELPGAVAADAAAFAADNRPVTAQGRTLTAWDVARAGPLTTMRTSTYEALARQAVSPDGRTLVSAGPGADQDVDVALRYDVAPGGTAPDGAVPDRAREQYQDQDAERLTAGENVELPGLVAGLAPRQDEAGAWLPAVSDDGTALVVESADGTVRELVQRSDAEDWQADLANLTADELRATYAPPVRHETGLRDVLAARVTTGGDLVLAAADGTVRVMDPVTGDPRGEATATGDTRGQAAAGSDTHGQAAAGGPWTTAEIAPDGRHVAFLSGTTVALVDPATGDSSVRTLATAGGTGPVLAFGDDELVVAHAGGVAVLERDDGAVRAASGVTVPGGPRSAAVLPGTGTAVVGGGDPLSVLVDLATGEQVGRLDVGTAAPVLTATAGRLLAVGSGTGNRRVVEMDTSPRSLLAAACAVAGRDLTAEEWALTVSTAPPPDLSCDRER